MLIVIGSHRFVSIAAAQRHLEAQPKPQPYPAARRPIRKAG